MNPITNSGIAEHYISYYQQNISLSDMSEI